MTMLDRSDSTESTGLDVFARPAWHVDAACRGSGVALFFDDLGEGGYRQAREVCAICPVQVECLEQALVTRDKFGLWGGRSESERRRLRRRRQERR